MRHTELIISRSNLEALIETWLRTTGFVYDNEIVEEMDFNNAVLNGTINSIPIRLKIKTEIREGGELINAEMA